MILYFQNYPAKRTCAINTSSINRVTYTKSERILYLGVATVSCSEWTRISATILWALSLNALCIIIVETLLALRRSRGCPYHSKRGEVKSDQRDYFNRQLKPFGLPEWIEEFCKVVLTFESVDEILWCDHSNESSLPVLSHGTICFWKFCKMKFGNFCSLLPLATIGSDRVKN